MNTTTKPATVTVDIDKIQIEHTKADIYTSCPKCGHDTTAQYRYGELPSGLYIDRFEDVTAYQVSLECDADGNGDVFTDYAEDEYGPDTLTLDYRCGACGESLVVEA